MPKSQKYLGSSKILFLLDVCLRGISQVIMVNNPVSGIIIFLGLFIHNPVTALGGLLGNMAGTACALHLYMAGYKGYDTYIYGIYGSNATLAGIGIFTFTADSVLLYPTPFIVVITSVVCVLVTNALQRLLGTTPVLLLPYNVAMIWILCGSHEYDSWWTGKDRFTPHLSFHTNFKPCLQIETGQCSDSFSSFLVATLNGVGQVFLAGDMTTGIFVIIAIAVYSPKGTWLALFGSFLGLVTGWLMGVNGKQAYMGWWSYNSVLAAMAIGGGSFGSGNGKTFIWGLVSAVLTAYLHSTMARVLLPVGLPALTLPFCLAALFLIGAGLSEQK